MNHIKEIKGPRGAGKTVIATFGNNVQTYLKENYYVLSKLEQCNDHFINLKLC